MGPPRQEIPNSFKRNTWDNALEQLKGAVMGVQQEGQEPGQDHVAFHQGLQHEARLHEAPVVEGEIAQGI